jgi:tartrate-resistant acid phosphatase type 5
MSFSPDTTRRRFLRQSFAFSALASLGSFAPVAEALAPETNSSEILMIGDWGYEDDHRGQFAVASAMRSYTKQHNLRPEALFFLGDNWYGALEGGATSPRWKAQFEDIYPAQEFPGPAYSILGNHDYQMFPMSKVDAELEYARSGKSRFTMPARWYTFDFPAKNPLVTFLALDSNVPYPDGKTKHGKDFTLTAEQYAEQLAWIEAQLKRTRSTPFLIAMGHHPVYSDGPHGDHATLIRDWDPLFRKYGVHLYMAGHDHDLQHLEFEGHPTSFWLSGGGGADLYDLKIKSSVRGPYAQKVYGFSQLSISKDHLTLRHFDSNGKLLHSFSKTPSGKVSVSS